MNMQQAIEKLDEAKSNNNARRDLIWYKNWVRLLKTGMPDLVALQVWLIIDESNGFKYEHVSISALHSLALALEDRVNKRI